MKKLTLLFVFCVAIAISNLFAQTNSIKVSSSGKVGINLASPAYQLDINGTVRMASGSYSILYSGASFYPNAGNLDLGSSG
jgi:hypothetical protein